MSDTLNAKKRRIEIRPQYRVEIRPQCSPQCTVPNARSFSDIEFVVDDAFGQDDKIAKRWLFRGTHTGEPNGMIPPTGKRITLVGTTLARMVDGKIVEERD